MRESSQDWRGAVIPTSAKPVSEVVHELRYISRHRRAKNQPTFRIRDAVLPAPVFTRPQHWVDVIKDSSMDLAYESLVGVHATTPGDAVGERERVTRRQYLADVLLPQVRRFLQNFFDLEVAKAVALDSRCPVDRSDPSAVPEPFLVLLIEPEVVKEPSQSFDLFERFREARRGDAVVHDERILFFLSPRAIIREFLSFGQPASVIS